MRHINSRARVCASLIVGLGAIGLSGHASADTALPTASTGSIVLDTMIVQARLPSNNLKIGKQLGTGSMDPVIAQISPTKILIADTASTTPDGNNGLQGTLTLIELTKDGPKVVDQLSMPREDGERVHMKMNLVPIDYKSGNQTGGTLTAAGTARVLVTYATEDNNGDPGAAGEQGSNNGNPQTVGWILNVSGAPSTTFAPGPLSNALNTKGTRTGPATMTLTHKTNMVSLTGTQDGQQYGAESVVCKDANCSIALQRNNNTTTIAGFSVNADGSMTKTVNRTTNNQNGQHSRPVFAADFKGRQFEAIVETNDQPARNVKIWENNPATTQTIKAQRVAAYIPGNGQAGAASTALYLSRPYAGAVRDLSDALKPEAKAALQAQSPIFTFYGVVAPVRNRNQVGGDNQNGHGGGATRTMLAALNPNTMLPMDGTSNALTSLPQNDTQPSSVRMNAANFGRHASMIMANAYGPVGAALPAAIVLSAPSTGSTGGFAQFVPYDPVTGKFDVRANKNKFTLGFADIATQSRGKRNPNDQAGAFLGGITDVVNPFYGDATAKQPEVKSYTIVPVSGAFNITGATADTSMGLRISMIPQTWNAAVAVTPGDAKPSSDVPNGPSPIKPSGSASGDTAGSPGGDTTKTNPDGTPSNGGDDPSQQGGGFGPDSATAGGCSVSTTHTSNLGGLALAGLGLAGLFVRRNRKSEQS